MPIVLYAEIPIAKIQESRIFTIPVNPVIYLSFFELYCFYSVSHKEWAEQYLGNWNFGIEHYRHMEF